MEIRARDPDADVLLLQFKGSKTDYQTVCVGASIDVGVDLVTIGFPKGSDRSTIKGVLSNKSGPSGLWQTDTAFSQGYSGAPVFGASRARAIVPRAGSRASAAKRSCCAPASARSAARSSGLRRSVASARWSIARSRRRMRSARPRTRSGSASRRCGTCASPPKRRASSSRRSTWRCSASPAARPRPRRAPARRRTLSPSWGIALRDQSGNLRRSEDLLADLADGGP